MLVKVTKGGAACALLSAILCFTSVVAAPPKRNEISGKSKSKNSPRNTTQTTPRPSQLLQTTGKVQEIPRDQISTEGVWFHESAGSSRQVRLPASVDFKEGNLFSAEGRWIRVTHLSKNNRTPSFRLGRREKYFQDNVLYPQEESILNYGNLFLFPRPGALASRVAVEAWMGDLDSFLILHRNDPTVIRQIQSFVFKYSNQPPRGYLPGDQLWDTRRRFATWNQFFEYPFQYDLSGTALMVDGKPIDPIPVFVSKEKLPGLPRLYPYVLRNLEYTFEALRTIMFESSALNGDEALAEVSVIRRSYLTLKLLQTGHELWERVTAHSK